MIHSTHTLRMIGLAVFCGLAIGLSVPGNASAETKTLVVDRVSTGDHFIGWVEDQIIVKFKEVPSSATMKRIGNKVAFTEQTLNELVVKYDITAVDK